MARQSYHHGDLRRVLLEAADEAIEEHGVAGLSMRDLARRANVSHAAPTHHFGDKAGLLTAFAAEGFEQLAQALTTARRASNSFLEMGLAYVRFAIERRAQFEVMFRPELFHADDPALLAAKARSADALYAGVQELPDGTLTDGGEIKVAGQAAWSMVHGFATLWLTGAFPAGDQDPVELARSLFVQLNRDHR